MLVPPADALSTASTEPITVPPKLKVNSCPLPPAADAFDTVIDAERKPAAEGVAVTATLPTIP